MTLPAPSARGAFRRLHSVAIAAALSTLIGAAIFDLRAQVASGPLPEKLSDRDFWQMIVDFSEPGGLFRSDNFVSNERTYQEVIPELRRRALPEGVYLGVGPDQNFTYITALRPKMAFIVDIRRQSLIHHLLYKAVIEMSVDRVTFLTRLFSRPPPELEPSATLEAIFGAFSGTAADEMLFDKHLADIRAWLVEHHGFPLNAEDLGTLEYVYRAFVSEGPDLRYSFPRQRVAPWFPTYAQLMLATDAEGKQHSYLASDESYQRLREFQRRNLLIPIVGDFGGEKALRAVGRYVTDHEATVNFVYTSNVEQYLFGDDAWKRYYASIAALPLNERSTFIRAYFDAGFVYPPGIVTPDLHSVQLLDPIHGLLKAVAAGEIGSYIDVVARSK